MKSKKIDITNKKFGRLLVIKIGQKINNSVFWECLCDCGNTKLIRAGDLLKGDSKSCGCLRKELLSKKNKKHGNSYGDNGKPTPEYMAWQNIKERCTNPNNKSFSYYGGRGIKMYDPWLNSFDTFLNDVGKRPSKTHSADRFPNNNGNYEPSNFRWATKSEQSNNMRSNRHIVYLGVKYNFSQFARLFNVFVTQVMYFNKKGYTSDQMACHFLSIKRKNGNTI